MNLGFVDNQMLEVKQSNESTMWAQHGAYMCF